MKTLTNCEKPSSNPLQTVCCGIQEPAYCSISQRWFWSVLRYYFSQQVDDWLLAFSKAELRFTISFELLPVSWGGGGAGNLMRLLVKYPELISFFIKASRYFKSTFWDIEDAKKFKNHRRLYTYQVLIWFLRHSKKLFISWPCPFNAWYQYFYFAPLTISLAPCSVGSTEPRTGLRPIIIDGSNVAMSHGRSNLFSVKGIQIVVGYFRQDLGR